MTGKRDDRPQYQALLAEIRRLRAQGETEVVVVARLDRFGRRLTERARCRDELKRLGVATHSVREGGEVDDRMAGLLAWLAEDEVRRLGERVSETKQHLAEKGWRMGGRVPWGYRLRPSTGEERKLGAPKCALEIDPFTSPYAREMFQRVAAGESICSVARWIARLPEQARGGRVFNANAVRFALRASPYVGRIDCGDGDTLRRPRANWPAIVDDDTFQQVQDRIARHQRIPNQASGHYLLTGLIFCPQCGCRMRGQNIAGSRGRSRYRCSANEHGSKSPDGCSGTATKRLVELLIIQRVVDILAAVLERSGRFRAALEKEWNRLAQPANDPSEQIVRLRKDAEQAKRRLTTVTTQFVDGLIDKTAYDLASSQYRTVLEAAEAELTRLGSISSVPTLPPLATVLSQITDWQQVMEEVDCAQRREVLAALVERIVPTRVGFGKYQPEITWTPLGYALQQLAAREHLEDVA